MLLLLSRLSSSRERPDPPYEDLPRFIPPICIKNKITSTSKYLRKKLTCTNLAVASSTHPHTAAHGELRQGRHRLHNLRVAEKSRQVHVRSVVSVHKIPSLETRLNNITSLPVSVPIPPIIVPPVPPPVTASILPVLVLHGRLVQSQVDQGLGQSHGVRIPVDLN